MPSADTVGTLHTSKMSCGLSSLEDSVSNVPFHNK